MTYAEQAALQKFIEQGHGWVGSMRLGLTGRILSANMTYWSWFETS